MKTVTIGIMIQLNFKRVPQARKGRRDLFIYKKSCQ